MKGNRELFERLWLILTEGEEKKELSLCQRKPKTNLYKKEEANSRIHNKETEEASSSSIPVCSMNFFIISLGFTCLLYNQSDYLILIRHEYQLSESKLAIVQRVTVTFYIPSLQEKNIEVN